MGFVLTSTGKFDLSNIQLKDIRIGYIAHGLSKICRYGSLLPLDVHYSVARHSLNLVYYARNNGYTTEVLRALLLHDASEAYLGDVPSPLKIMLPDYQQLEAKLTTAIERKYKISSEAEHIVKELDTRIVLDEAKEFFPSQYYLFTERLPDTHPLNIIITKDKDLDVTKAEFLSMFKQLGVNNA